MALFEQPVFIQPTHTPHLCQFFGLTRRRWRQDNSQRFWPSRAASADFWASESNEQREWTLKKDNKKLDRHGTVAAKACLGLGYKAREKGPWSEL